jgi:hypothetical protein
MYRTSISTPIMVIFGVEIGSKELGTIFLNETYDWGNLIRMISRDDCPQINLQRRKGQLN